MSLNKFYHYVLYPMIKFFEQITYVTFKNKQF